MIMCSKSSKMVRACGKAVRVTAPTTAPKVEAMPPNTTMVTSSMDLKKPAFSGVMIPA